MSGDAAPPLAFDVPTQFIDQCTPSGAGIIAVLVKRQVMSDPTLPCRQIG
jgi:hypothetical protein